MKQVQLPVFLLLCGFITACNPRNAAHRKYNPPKAGSIVVADTIAIAEDKLNDQSFSVTVFTNDSSVNGSYDVAAAWGYNMANTSIRMPYGGEDFKPLLRKGDAPYSYIIGFHFNDDTIFHDYYEITAREGQIAARYIRAYTLE